MRRLMLMLTLMLGGCTGRDDVDTDTDPPDTDLSPNITCGEEICDGAAEYCLTSYPGQPPDTDEPPPDYTDCEPLPPACLADVTCACLISAGEIPAFADCTGDATTGLSATIAYP